MVALYVQYGNVSSAGSHGVQKRVGPGPLELELEVVMNHPMCVLATELESFGKTAWAADPSPQAPKLSFLMMLLSITKIYFLITFTYLRG